MKNKIAFFGTPDVSAKILSDLVNSGFQVSLVITQQDRPVGRKQIITPPEVKITAMELGITVLQPEKLDESFIENIKDFDLGIVVAYGKIIPEKVINTFKKGMINVHYSLLPKWRGASPVENAILNGDKETGVSIQKLVYELDAGPIISEKKISLDNEITGLELRDELTRVGSDLLIEILPGYLEDKINLKEQNHEEATFCKKIKKEHGEIDLTANQEAIWRKYRAYYGWPGVFFFNKNGKRIKVTEATFIDGKFVVNKAIPEGKKEIEIKNPTDLETLLSL